jgi:hypothetical protein
MEAQPEKTRLLSVLAASFSDLPWWQKATVVLSIVVLSPALVLVGPLVLASILPFLLLGKLEGPAGNSLTKDVAKLIADEQERTKRYYHQPDAGVALRGEPVT